MSKYIVLKVLEVQSVCLPSTLIYRDVELRSSNADFDFEVEILKESAELMRLDFSKYLHCARISTVVDSSSSTNAINLADNKFSEILDLKSIELPTSNFSLSRIGYTKNLETGEYCSIVPHGYQPSMAFFVKRGDIQPFDVTNFMLSINSELSQRYLRSLHWSRNSKHEKNSQLKILFNWFAVEALLKENESDNIGGQIRWFLGFPNGKAVMDVSPRLKLELSDHPKYDFWKDKIIGIVDKIRVFRNESVHSGFRSVDFTSYEIELYKEVMSYGTSRCQAAVQLALLNGMDTVQDFKEYIALIFEQNSNIINDVHGNIIFSLDRVYQTKKTESF